MSWLRAAISLKPQDVGLPTSTSSLGAAALIIINTLIYIVGALSVIAVIVGGLQIVLSNGDPKRYQQGRETILYAVIGVVLSLSAYAIVNFVIGRI